jgi:hypothetical protein
MGPRRTSAGSKTAVRNAWDTLCDQNAGFAPTRQRTWCPRRSTRGQRGRSPPTRGRGKSPVTTAGLADLLTKMSPRMLSSRGWSRLHRRGRRGRIVALRVSVLRAARKRPPPDNGLGAPPNVTPAPDVPAPAEPAVLLPASEPQHRAKVHPFGRRKRALATATGESTCGRFCPPSPSAAPAGAPTLRADAAAAPAADCPPPPWRGRTGAPKDPPKPRSTS